MYTTEDYDRMQQVPAPAIQRIDFTTTALQVCGNVSSFSNFCENISQTCVVDSDFEKRLQIKAMGIHDIRRFGFMDPPQPERVDYACKRLRALGALDKEMRVTPLGFQVFTP